MTRITYFVISLSLTTSLALSENPPTPIPPVSLPGVLGEAVLGFEGGVSRLGGDHFNLANTPATNATYLKIGDHYGSFAEYQYEIGSSRIYVATTFSASVTNSKKLVEFDAGSFVMKRARSATAGFAIGKMVNPKTKVYGNFSYDFSTYELTYDLTVGGPQATIKQKLQGPALGGGMYYKVASSFIAGIDYKYVMFRQQDIRKGPTTPTALKPTDQRIVVRLGWNLSFG